MSWQQHLRTVVRVLINDLDSPYEFSDSSGITRKITAENLVNSLVTEIDGGELL